MLWGAEGTVSQHSFHQLLHQGTQVVPCGFHRHRRSTKNLSANCRAQADALAFGTDDPALAAYASIRATGPPACCFSRSSTRGTSGGCSPLYEHKVFTQGVIWNINSFDQWGVELGKELAKKILSGGKLMDQETFNLSIRKFLKMVGVNSQREIEQAVQKAMQSGKLKGDETIPVKMTLEIPQLGAEGALRRRDRLK